MLLQLIVYFASFQVPLDTVKELPDKADDYVVGFGSSSEIVGDDTDSRATKQQKEFIALTNAGGDDSENNNLAEGEITETKLLEKMEGFEDVTRNR